MVGEAVWPWVTQYSTIMGAQLQIRRGLLVTRNAHGCASVMCRRASRGRSSKTKSKANSWSTDYLAQVIPNITLHLSGKCGL